ncbi:MAG TPA: GGDEF domain-containing protein [Methylomirabilota bacterium]|jgi:diguanylate cyclase (GGDEF)-like protein|nr:GGDEF domain-containing protein [Methylomirabilota bacterium]
MARRARAAETPAARRIKRKILIAMALTAFLPMLVVAYLVYAYALPLLDPQAQERNLPWMLVMLGGTGLLMAAGSFMLWDLATSVVRHADALDAARRSASATGTSRPTPSPETSAVQQYVQQSDEVDTLMHSFSRMLVTIEQQASDVNEYARRLDTAYKELESTSAQLKEFSFKDEVTGLYNRRFFSIRLEEEVSRYRRFNHPVSVVLLDLDGFKAVNDDLGHGAGDETLRAMAEILLKQSRGINVICRYGGDEFAVLLVETSKSGARLYADRIRYVLSTWTFAHGRRVTASFGIASLPEDVAPAAEELIRAADEALYAAKRAGKNRVSVHEDVAAGRPTGRPGA